MAGLQEEELSSRSLAALQEEELPGTVSSAQGTIAVLHGEAGLVSVEDSHCFFRLQDCWGCDTDLRVGSRVQLSARLCPAAARQPSVPYICSSVWPEGAELPSALALRVMSPPTLREVAQYRATVAGLQPLLPTSDMQGILRPPPQLVPFEELSSRIESQLAASIEELEGRKKHKKKKRQKSGEKEKPVKHLDFLHKINDVIAELERDVPEVMARVKQEEEQQQWGTSYPTQEQYSAVHGAPSITQPSAALAAAGSSNWLGLVVAPGSKPTPLQSLPHKAEPQPAILPPTSKWAGPDSGSEPDSPVNKKSLFTDMFEEPLDGAESPKILQPAKGVEQVRGPGLADLMKNRLNRVSVDEVKEVKVLKEVDRSTRRRSRSQSKSRSRSRRSRSKEKKKKEKIKRKKRSRSRSEQKKKKKKSTEKSFSSSPEKKKKSKHKKHKNKEDRSSRSKSRSKAKKRKKERSRSKSRKQKKRKRSRSSSRRCSKSAETKRSKSRSRSSERRSKRPRSRSPSRKEEERSSVVRSVRSASRSVSRGPVARSTRSQSRSRRFSRSVSKVAGGSASESRERSQLVGIKEETSEEEDEETIVAKRRLDRLKLVAKLKEKRDEEESRVKADDNGDVKVGDCVTSSSDAPLWPPPPPPLEEKIPCSVYDQENLEKVKEVREEVAEQEAPAAGPAPVVVTLDAEVLVVGSRSFLTQIGAFAWTSEPSFQPLSFHRCILTDLVRDRDILTPASRTLLMDTFRLKTSNFDVTKSGQKQVVFKHPEKGKVGLSEEREALVAFLEYLESLGGPVILVPHSRDAVLPLLLALLTEQGLHGQFSAFVSHVCDLVSLAWTLRLDRLWIGKKHPGLREVSRSLSPDIQWEDSSLPVDRTAAIMWTVLERVRSRDPAMGLLAQAGGQTVVEYLTSKYHLMEGARGEETSRPAAVEVGLGSEQWGRKERIEMAWQRESVARAKERILERLREKQDRRTPVPVPDEQCEEEAVRIVSSKTSDRRQRLEEAAREREGVERVAKELREVREETREPVVEVKSYNAFLPAGVLEVPQGGSVTALLKVPGLKPRAAEVVGMVGSLEQKEEFSLGTLRAETGEVEQPRDSMFPAVKVVITASQDRALTLDSKAVNYPVAVFKI